MKEIIKMGMDWVDNEEHLDFKTGKILIFGFISFFVLVFGTWSIGLIMSGFVEIMQALMGNYPK